MARSAGAGFVAPSVALPKGGGAIRGIGETFTNSPVTGTSGVTIPLPLSPGRAGFTPTLALSYDSGAGNGPYGIGWTISLPAISRRTDGGLPRYFDDQESDVFLLSGAEDLVPVLRNDGSRYVEVRDGFRVHRYRPRVERLFARVERWTSVDDPSDTHWRSISRTNITTVYGRSSDSRVADPRDQSRVFSWLACESFDDKGNAAIYDYAAEDGRSIDAASASEGNRTAVDRGAGRYLKRVRYGNRTSTLLNPDLTSTSWLFELVMDFGDHDDDAPTPSPSRSWPARPDPFSTYRAGFEVRTYRRCQRVLMFHQFDELSPAPRLVRTLKLDYDDLLAPSADALHELAHQGSTRLGSFLRRVTSIGHGDDGVSRDMPPLELTYSRPTIDSVPRAIERESIEGLRGGVDGVAYQWVDLDGEGLPGVFGEQPGAWWYKQNLGAGRLGPARPIEQHPQLAERAQFLDLAGDGHLDAVRLRAPAAGFYERNDQSGWSQFTPFTARPNVAWQDSDVRLVDLTGDGHADLLISQGSEVVWRPSLGEAGFGASERVVSAFDERTEAPPFVFHDPRALVTFADMSGDGLPDLVRIRNGEVCYWPNLGYGKFGARIVMDGAPLFDVQDQFDPARIRFADIDGSGVSDLIYLGRNAVHLYFNCAGNGFADGYSLGGFPKVDNVATVTVTDLLGLGTACLVLSNPISNADDGPIRFIDLMGGVKPHLLIGVDNNLGARTALTYAASTKFYLADRAAGRDWTTRLPFPVHVVERTETFDEISRNRFVRRFVYHDGYFDGQEREFRGFAEVEQFDTEEIAALGPAANVDGASHVPPMLTRTRFHTGAERGDAVLPTGLTTDEEREAIRALKGAMLRQEVFALDGTERQQHAYSITAQQLEVRRIQTRGPNRHAVFFTHPRESITSHTERRPEDPRVMQTTALEVDDFGNVLLSASVSYGRHQVDLSLSAEDRARQSETHVSFAETVTTNAIDAPDTHRTPLECETRSYELTGVTAPVGRRFRFDELQEAWRDAATSTYEIAPTSGVLEKRLFEHTRTLYRKDDLSGTLPLGDLESMALPFETYRLAFTTGLASQVFSYRITDDLLSVDGRYVHMDGDAQWWIPSGRVGYAPAAILTEELAEARAHFFTARRYVDPFGNAAEVSYDAYDLLIEGTRDALGNRTSANNDYRVLAPRIVTDPNGNRSAVAFDALGLVVATALMGKVGEVRGDSLDDVPIDLPAEVLLAHVENPLVDPHTILGHATTRLVYDLFAYRRTKDDAQPAPAVVYTLARETHASDLGPDERTAIQYGFAYSDGFGRVVQSKARAEAGPDGSTRWIASGWTLFDNKGQPVRKFEPFYAESHRYEPDVRAGVSAISFYDPLGRLVGTLRPDHAWDKVVFDAWRQETWDVNDTVLLDPKDDPDLGSYFSRLTDAEYLPTWYARRLTGTANEKAAAAKAAAHAATPAVGHLDSLARVFLTSVATGDEPLTTRTIYDIEGNQRAVFDALGRMCARYDYDLVGRRIHQASMEAGERWVLPDIAGKPVSSWDSRGHHLRTRYDELQRPVETLLGNIVVGRTTYGESTANPEIENLRGRPVRQFDQAGIVTTERYDFKGNLVASHRQLARDYKGVRDWSSTVPLEAEVFTRSTSFDALNRPIAMTAPDGSIIRPHYNESSLPDRLDVNLRGAAQTTAFVTDIEYNARGQRLAIQHENGVRCTYAYAPDTFRLAEARSTRTGGALLQDLHYTYDPAGNITHIDDTAKQAIYFANDVVEATNDYRYDALYRLVAAEGREHIGQVTRPEPTWNDAYRTRLAHPQDGQAMRRYTETYRYDLAGNLLELVHSAQNTRWTRRYDYAEASQLEPNRPSNRLTKTTVGGADEPYAYDPHGNLIAIPHLSSLAWNFLDQLEASSRQVVTSGTAETTYYVYDASGQRVRKVTERQNGTRKHERIYLGEFELYREFDASGTAVSLARETLHVSMNQPVALVETRTQGSDPGPAKLVRYQLTNHLGSATLEVDSEAQVISYEEYYPYGTTSYQAVRSQTEAPKRYRYTGMERDDETGFGYHHARYYAPWLGRWTACDPNGASPNLYEYCRGNPITHTDRNGRDPEADRLASVNRFLDVNRDKVLTLAEVLAGFEDVNMTLNEWSISMRQQHGAGFRYDNGVDALIDYEFPAMSVAARSAMLARTAEFGNNQDADGYQYTRADRRAANEKNLNRHRNPRRLITTAAVAAAVLAPVVTGTFNAGIKFGEAISGRRSGIRLGDLLTGNYRIAGKTMSRDERIASAIEGGIDAIESTLAGEPRRVKVGGKFTDSVKTSAKRASEPSNVNSGSEALRKLQRRQSDIEKLGLFDDIPLTEPAVEDLVHNILDNAVTQRYGRLKVSGYAGQRGIALFDEFGRGILVRHSDGHFVTFLEEPRGLGNMFR